MAKTIMISNETYDNLKRRKGNKSFSKTIDNMLIKKKTGEGLKEFFGILKDDKEYDELMKEMKKGWKRWTRKYS